MKTPKILQDIRLYRMTHVSNIPHVLKYGITGIHSPNSNPDYRPIGDTTLINYRESKVVTTMNGGRIRLGDFTPFYFGVRMPMLYVIQHGGNFVPSATSPSEIIYIVLSLESVANAPDADFYFTDGHATDSLTMVYDKSRVKSLPQIVDWEAVATRWWSGGGVTDMDVKRRKQAEFLVRGDIPASRISGYICSCGQTRDRLVSYGVDWDDVKVIPQAYY